jgi:hypothetical protein
VQCHAPAGTVAAKGSEDFCGTFPSRPCGHGRGSGGNPIAAGPQMSADIAVTTSVIVPAQTTEHRRPLAIKNSNGRTMTL